MKDLVLIHDSIVMAQARGTAGQAELRVGHTAHAVLKQEAARWGLDGCTKFMGLPVVVRDNMPMGMFQVFDVRYGALTEGYVSNETQQAHWPRD